jgi:putative SOS response-associated peptidase YedK
MRTVRIRGAVGLVPNVELGDVIHTFTIITTDPDRAASAYHNRMPVLYGQARAESGLNITMEPFRIRSTLADRLITETVSVFAGIAGPISGLFGMSPTLPYTLKRGATA